MLHKRPLALAVSAAIGAASALGMAPAFAQDEQLVEEVVVTGSRIQRANLVSSSPVQQLDAEQLRYTGLTRVEDALASIPAISLDQSSGQAIEATGTATLQLRNLGAQRTLVLMNGRRLPANSPNGGAAASAADINLIPGQLVKRVEVLTGGASSTYGADAVAGVVNFIMVDDFEGIKIDGQFGQFWADNDGGLVADAARAAGEPAGLPFPTGTARDGDQYDLTMIMGGNFDNGRGNATAFVTYRDIEGVVQSQRDTSLCPVRASGVCLGSGTNLSGSFIFPDNSPTTFRVEGNEFLAGAGQGFNFAAPSLSQRPDRRTTIGTFAHYDVNEHVEAYTELMFMDTKSFTQFGQSGIFFNNFTINCDNPLLSDQQRAATGGCASPDDEFAAVIGRRNVEGGPRQGELRHTTYRGVFGVRGDINDTWRYDVSYQYAEVDMANLNRNYVDVGRVQNALQVVQGDNGPECIVGGECVPYDIFSTGGVTDEATSYFSQEVYESGRTTQEVLMAYVQGSLGDYGLVVPFAENGIEVVVGVEYREESLTYDLSDNAKRGEAGGFGIPTPVSGRYDVNDFYVEASVPVVEDAPFVKSLTLDLGYRYSDYSTGATTDTYKVAGSWDIVDSFKLRGSYQRAVRAPNIIELFEPVGGGLFAMDRDPCKKATPGAATSISGYSFEQCARSGVSRAIWDLGGPDDSPAAQYNSIDGGSTELEPEEADTYSLGAIWTPGFIDGLTVSVDWYDIEITGAIQGVAPETTLLQCIETGDPQFCDAVDRGLNDTLWIGQAAPGLGIDSRSTNIGFFRVEGIDLNINYNFDIGDMGTVNISNIAGFVMAYEQEEYAGAGVVECDGIYGGSCGIPIPDLKNRFQATWATPWNVSANVIWRYVGPVDQEFTSVPNDLDAYNYFDLAATWDVTDSATLRIGINNVFDEDPPFVYQGVTARENGNTYPGIYDPLGQYFFLGGTIQF